MRVQRTLRCILGDIYKTGKGTTLPNYYIIDNDLEETTAFAIITTNVRRLLHKLQKRGLRIINYKTYKPRGVYAGQLSIITVQFPKDFVLVRT